MIPHSPARVLIVDDDAMSRDLLGILLEAEGYATESADSGDAALALLADGRSAPEIVLSDMQMPGIAGSQLADELRRACGPSVILLAMSGSGATDDTISHFDGFLLKPFTLDELTAAIREADGSRAAPTAPAASNSDMNSELQELRPKAVGAEVTGKSGPPLDERIYTQLNDAMPKPQLHQMYEMCLKDARDRITTMRGLVARHDAAQFVRQAHAIKGGCGMLGATELYAMATQLEKSGLRAAGLEGTQGVNPLDELTAACDRLERILGSRASGEKLPVAQ
jgi:CheY-like chemotaxis protein